MKEQILPRDYKRLDSVIVEFLNTTYDEILCKLNTSEIAALRVAAAKEDFIKIHNLGYSLK
jgi:hypothetical protein